VLFSKVLTVDKTYPVPLHTRAAPLDSPQHPADSLSAAQRMQSPESAPVRRLSHVGIGHFCISDL